MLYEAYEYAVVDRYFSDTLNFCKTKIYHQMILSYCERCKLNNRLIEINTHPKLIIKYKYDYIGD